MTDHKTGLIRVVPYPVHLGVDILVGVVFAIAPIALDFTGIDAAFSWINAAAVLTVVGLHKSEGLPQSVMA